jgi:thiamine-monophosphate kinase
MKTVGGVGELELLELIKPYVAEAAGHDDAAAWSDERGGFTVASADMYVEGVHFDLAWMTAEDAGWRSLALALGDMAAKGATPLWALTSVAVPRSWPLDGFEGLFQGLHALARKVGLNIVGGDMSAIDGPAVLSITVVGRAPLMPLSRSEAKPGWSVAVTGPLGAAAVALREHRPLRLEPLLAEGRRLNEAGLCCGDISDGLLREMEKFAAMSRFGSVLRAAEVPVAEGATQEEALTSGEEAQLVCVGPEDKVRAAGLTPIGVMSNGREVQVVDAGGKHLQPRPFGYDHFA